LRNQSREKKNEGERGERKIDNKKNSSCEDPRA